MSLLLYEHDEGGQTVEQMKNFSHLYLSFGLFQRKCFFLFTPTVYTEPEPDIVT